MSNKIIRQHSETEVQEIIGDCVDKMLAVKGASKDTVAQFYVLLLTCLISSDHCHLEYGLL